MIRRFQRYIEEEPWERYIDEGEKWLNIAAWIVIILAAIYFFLPLLRHFFMTP